MEEKITLANICGYKEEKEQVRNIIKLLNNYKEYEKQGVTIPRGLIFQGPPGTGKTLFAKAIAGECNYDFNVAFSNEVAENTLDTLKLAFETAEERSKKDKKPALIYIDELDKLVYTDTYGNLVDKDAREAARFLLQKLDETRTTNRILIIASTNNYGKIPNALLRSGRFDKKLLMDLPDAESRKEILKFYIKDHPLFKHINLSSLALKTQGMSGADLKTLINNTLLEYITKKESVVLDDFIKIINEMNFETIGKEWASDTVALEVLAHEIGHAVVGYDLTKNWGNVNALRYGDTEGSTTLVRTDFDFEEPICDDEGLNAEEEKSHPTYQSILDEVCISLGGKAAEEVLLGEKSIGLGGDLRNIRRLFGFLNDNACFGFDLCDSYYADATPAEIRFKSFNYFSKLIKRLYKKTKKIVSKNKLLCLYLVDEIHSNNDVLSGEEINKRYKYYLKNKTELDRKYNKLTVRGLVDEKEKDSN